MRKSLLDNPYHGLGNSDILASGLTDPGKTRELNEDSFAVCDDLGLYIVSDGMGGAQAGEVASSLVAKALPAEVVARMSANAASSADDIADCLWHSIDALSRRMYEQTSEVGGLRGMGATVVACLIQGNIAAIGHMGDSRAYLIRDGALERLTEDHALADTLLRLGQISKTAARDHPGRHVLTRYMGMEGVVGPDVGTLTLKEGDRLLLCSDGLTNMVDDRLIGTVMWSESNIAFACRTLVNEAKEAGGEDNVSVLIIQYGPTPPDSKHVKRVAVRRTLGRSLKRFEIAANESEHQQGERERSRDDADSYQR